MKTFRIPIMSALLAMTFSYAAAQQVRVTDAQKALKKSQLEWKTARIAAVQLVPPQGEDPADIVVSYIGRAASDSAQLVVFPEYHLGKVKLPDPKVDKVSRAAKENHIYVIVGCFEYYGDGTFSNVAFLFGRDGSVIGRHKKVHGAVGVPPYFWPPKEDDVEWLMKSGDSFDVFDLDFATIGIMTCYDGYFTESYEIMSLKGAEILVWLNGRPYIEDYLVKAGMFLNYVDMICTNHGYATMIAEYPNTIKKICLVPQNDYIVDDLDLQQLRICRKHSRVFHQRKPEVYGDIVKTWPVWDAYEDLKEY
ncbi:carbon-nitrogen hydrolase family protein [bacterium]|nr:carbon-nitrogen hydrolase family protein [bacterium]